MRMFEIDDVYEMAGLYEYGGLDLDRLWEVGATSRLFYASLDPVSLKL